MKSLFAVAFLGPAILAEALPEGMYGGGSNANLSCPGGFSLTGKLCEKPIYGMPTIRCALGSLVGDQCVTHSPITTACPIGSVPDGKECAIVQTRAPETRCPSGFAPTGNGGCQQRTPLPLIATCDIGHDASEGCQMVEHAQKVVRTFCGNGFHDEGNGCVRLTEYDCSPPFQHGKEQPILAPILEPLPLPSFGGKKRRGYNRRMLGAKKYNIYSPPIIAAPPPSKTMVVPSPAIVAPPPPAVQVVSQTCTRKDFAPPIIESACPDGFAEGVESCQKISHYPKTEKCINGAPANACYDVKTVPVQVSCAKGVLNGEVCQFKETIEPIQVCPAGSTQSGTGDARTACQQATMARAVCPAGTALQGQQCVGRETAEPTGTHLVPCSGKGCFH